MGKQCTDVLKKTLDSSFSTSVATPWLISCSLVLVALRLLPCMHCKGTQLKILSFYQELTLLGTQHVVIIVLLSCLQHNSMIPTIRINPNISSATTTETTYTQTGTIATAKPIN